MKTQAQRVVLGALAGSVVALQRITLYQDYLAANEPIATLAQRGIRQVVCQIFNTAAMTFEIYTKPVAGSSSYVLYDTFPVPVYSNLEKNTFAYDVSGLPAVLIQLVDGGSGQASGFAAIAEGETDVQDLGCSNG
jgi:hypothetical protein